MSQTLEEWHAFIAAHLAEPVDYEERADGATYFTSGNPGEVIVRLSRASITVWEYSIAQDGAYQQVVRPRLIGAVRWRRISERAGMKAVQALIEAARESRQAKFRTCAHCGERLPPEWMLDEGDSCLSCGQRRSGVVH